MMKRFLSIALIVTGLFLSLFAVSASGAINISNLDRTATAGATVDDDAGIITLTGLNNNSYVLNTTYQQIATITNNSNQSLLFRVYMDPEITRTRNASVTWTLRVRIINSAGTSVYQFSFTGKSTANPAGVWSSATANLPIASGETYTLRGYLSVSNKTNFNANAIFSIQAVNSSGLSVYISDSASSPRKQYYTAQ